MATATIVPTFAVNNAANTFASITVTGAATVGTTLGVTGTSTLAAVNATTISGTTGAFSGTITTSNAAPILNSTAATAYLQTFQNNGTSEASLDLGGMLVPTVINTASYYFSHDWDFTASASNVYTQNGNVVSAAVNSVSAPLLSASTAGIAYCNTSSTTAGGYISGPNSYAIIKSATINYQWRQYFYHPAVSTSSNRYTSFVGGFLGTGTANNANAGPLSGPFIKYSDNANSGNVIMGSSVNGTITTANGAVAPTLAGWNILIISLANGVFTFTLNGSAVGTLTDSNITTSVANLQSATYGGIMIIPDGTNFTTNRVLMIDRSDFWITGMSR